MSTNRYPIYVISKGRWKRRQTVKTLISMGVDFKLMKNAANEVGDQLDHRYLNDLEPFKKINPTAENIAAYMYKEISARLNSDTVKVTALTIWETERACVRYSEEN